MIDRLRGRRQRQGSSLSDLGRGSNEDEMDMLIGSRMLAFITFAKRKGQELMGRRLTCWVVLDRSNELCLPR